MEGGLNTYAYAEGNPLIEFDPEGLVGLEFLPRLITSLRRLPTTVVAVEGGTVGQTGRNDAKFIVINGKEGFLSPIYPGSTLPGDPKNCATIQAGIYSYSVDYKKSMQDVFGNGRVLRVPGNVPVVGGRNPNPKSDSYQGNAPTGTANGILNHPTNINDKYGNGLCGCTGVRNDKYSDYIKYNPPGNKGKLVIIRLP